MLKDKNMKKKYKGVCFLVGVLIVIVCGLFAHITTDAYMYDSMDYYVAAKSFISSGKFSLYNYSNTYRGYCFPMILCFYTLIGNAFGIPEWISILVGNSLVASFSFTICLPNILPDRWKMKDTIFLRLAPLGVILVFWKYLIVYPLTDIYSFGIILLVANLSLRLKNSWKIIVQGFIIGFLIYVAYNIRTIYLFSAILFFLILFIDCWRKQIGIKKIIFLYMAIIIGIVISSYPQMKININQHNRKSIAVITEDLNGGELFTSQLYVGMFYDRYETYVGPNDVYPDVPMNFIDRAGLQIISNEKITGFDSLGQYIKVILKHPIDYIGVIVRHIMSILYMPWNQGYIYDLNKWKVVFMVLNYTILYFFAICAYRFFKENSYRILINRNMAYVSATLFPCIAILFGAVEMRFFMPVYSFIYLFICAGDFKENFFFIKKYLLKNVIFFIIVFCLLVGYWGAIMASAQGLPQLLM